MNETSINSAVVPALIYLNPNQAPNTAQSKTALAVSGKYWNTNTMQYSKKNILYKNVYFVTRTAYWLRFFLADEWYLDNHEDQRSMFWSPVTSSGRLPPSLSSSENPFRHLEVLSQFQKTKSIPETATWSQRCSHVSVDIKVLLYKTITIMFGYIHQISYIFSEYLETIFTKFYFCIISKQLLVDRV